MIQIELQPEVEAVLAAEAEARGMVLERYIVEKLLVTRSEKPADESSIRNAIDSIRELRKGNRLGGLRIEDLVHEGHRY